MSSFLRCHTRTRPRNSILKVSCHRESGKLYGGLLPSCFTGSASHGQASTHALACAVVPWSVGKYWLNNLDRVSRCWHILLHSIKKSDLLMSSTLSLDQSLGIKFTVADTMFSKILIFNLKAQSFIINRYCWFALETTGFFCSCSRRWLSETQV